MLQQGNFKVKAFLSNELNDVIAADLTLCSLQFAKIKSALIKHVGCLHESSLYDLRLTKGLIPQ